MMLNEQMMTHQARIITIITRSYLTLLFPVLLILIAVRLVMTPAFLYFEYTRSGFPEDFYGLTREERLQYAPYAIEYLFNGEDIAFLDNLTFPNGDKLFTSRELRHMRDVKVVTQYTFLFATTAGILALVSAYWLRKRDQLRPALLSGSILTLGIISAIIIVAVFNWDFFFVGFHRLFFENDTWYFAYSDTLIRLFPEQFWFDAALLVGGLSTLVALIVLFVTWKWRKLL
jgi:integral membrane protein (TIGR01906 family)